MKPLLSVIVVSYNTLDLTLETLQSVERDIANSELLKGRCELIVVDNNSKDKSVSELHRFASSSKLSTQVLVNKKNSGYSSANNQGIAASSAPFILLLNSDTIIQKGALEQLVSTLQQNKSLGIVAATLLNKDGTLQAQGGHAPSLLTLTIQQFFLDDIPFLGSFLPSTQHTGLRTTQRLNTKNSELIYQDWVGGTALCVKRQVFDEVDLLDDAIFMYGEDIEFCLRAKKHLWQIAIDPRARVMHFQSMSSSSESAIIGELLGYHYIWAKHMPLWQLPFATLILELGCLARVILYSTLKPNKAKAQTYFSGIKKLIAQ